MSVAIIMELVISDMKSKFSLTHRLRSFRHAIKGIINTSKTEHNFRIHLVATALAILLGYYFEIASTEWLWLIAAIGLVLITETINTAIEKLVDLKSPEQNEKAGLIKDISAGAVLIAAATSLAIGLLIFIPKII